MIGASSVGVPEILVILFISALWLIPIAAAIWALMTLNRLRVTQDAMRRSLDQIARGLKADLDSEPSRPLHTSGTGAPSSRAAACAWCGRPVSEEEAFMLRVGARLCPSCAEDAGRIAAEQRVGKDTPPKG